MGSLSYLKGRSRRALVPQKLNWLNELLAHSPLRNKMTNEILIPLKEVKLKGELNLQPDASSLVLFAHGSGSSRRSPRNQFVARTLREHGNVGTLLFDLLTAEEERSETQTRHLRFNIPFLAERLVEVTRWVLDNVTTRD